LANLNRWELNLNGVLVALVDHVAENGDHNEECADDEGFWVSHGGFPRSVTWSMAAGLNPAQDGEDEDDQQQRTEQANAAVAHAVAVSANAAAEAA
jgi:hypothetical protein